jgi:hypothetical protein
MKIEAAKIANDPSILFDGVLPPILGEGWSEQSDRILEQGPIPEPEIEGPGESADGEDESGEDAQEAGEG